MSLDIGRKYVADVTYGFDQARIGRIALNLLFEPAHLGVDAAIERRSVLAAQQV